MNRLVLGALALACLALNLSPALAAEGSVLSIPWGDTLNNILRVAVEGIIPVAGAAVAAAAIRLPWWVTMWLTTQRIDRALKTGADYALNAVEGATAGKALSVDVGFTVLKVALERILGSTPNWLIKEMGGAKGISERLFRVFKFDETVSDRNTLTPLIQALPNLPFVK
ncbi:hypothetical protein [Methylobacterium sp. Leaf85]|uniref:hypothetical protein n=1 Tax=Methylobacterium sp. Leaf85 TaxID=1736241 RepID=UPI0006F907BF|nr:hypothetical protein [Methylobacterium sp. Leaf85]KQO43039.1 hypothetical protein ASF08_10710 [Methylobacterium sp. Leaf85]